MPAVVLPVAQVIQNIDRRGKQAKSQKGNACLRSGSTVRHPPAENQRKEHKQIFQIMLRTQ